MCYVPLYVDLIWLLNLLFDWMVLLLVCWATKSIYQPKRIVLAALFASMIIPLQLSFSIEWVTLPLVKLVYSILIILIAFKYQRLTQLILQWLSFYFINFTIGGAMFGLHFFMMSHDVLLDEGATPFGNWLSWGVVLVLFPVAYFLTKHQLQQLTVNQMKHDQYYQITIHAFRKSISIKGFLDTGNQLKHPLSKKPVILVDEETFRNWFNEETLILMKQQDESVFQHTDGLHWIPFRKAGGERGLLPVFLADEVLVHTDSTQIKTPHVYVGFHEGKLSQQMDVHCLLHPMLWQSKQMQIKHYKGVS